jgi:hypothetical protein
MVKWNAFLSGLCGFVVALGLVAASARADVTTERGASILAFPKVLADGASETIIQISNVSNSMVQARCFYLNAQLTIPSLPEGYYNPPLCQETDFTISLTKQQPTHWQVSTGRFVDPTDSCFSGNNTIDPTACDTAGIDPGAIPPVPGDFVGELKCVEVDAAGNPIGGNHLKGEATIITLANHDVSKYNAVGIEGTELAGQTGNLLRLDQPSDTVDAEGQYNACPNVLILNHFAEGATDPVVLANGRGGTCSGSDQPCEVGADCGPTGTCENGSDIDDPAAPRSATLTNLTLMPCAEDFENQIFGRVTVQFDITNEFEQHFSASTTVGCWKSFLLHEVDSANNPERSVFARATLGSTVAQTRISPVPESGGVIGVASVLRADRDRNEARVALNVHIEGDRFSATEGNVVDEIVLPEE